MTTLTNGQRKSFLFPAEAIRIMDWLRKVCRVGTDSDVVRLGLGCLADLMVADREGAKIYIRSPDGTEKLYHPVFDLEEEEIDPIEDLKVFRSEIRQKSA